MVEYYKHPIFFEITNRNIESFLQRLIIWLRADFYQLKQRESKINRFRKYLEFTDYETI